MIHYVIMLPGKPFTTAPNVAEPGKPTPTHAPSQRLLNEVYAV
ncbi:unnamed protein product, partial [marine sediment metagenome]